MVNCNSPGQEETYHSRFPVAQAICLTLHQVALEYVFIEWRSTDEVLGETSFNL